MIKEPLSKENQNEPDIEFKTLITEADYNKILKENESIKGDLQINYYFDTTRFTLKASEAVLRIKRTDKHLTIILERKKNYAVLRIEEEITEDEFNDILNNHVIKHASILEELNELIKNQPIVNFMTFSTYRINIPFKDTKFALDKCEYCDMVDYELEYRTKNRESGKLIFVEFIKKFNLQYERSQSKLKRAYDALKKMF